MLSTALASIPESVSVFVPAVVGLPGGPELVIVFLIMFLLFGIPVALAAILGYKYIQGQTREQATEERISDLESELETLREKVDEPITGGGEASTPDESASVPPTSDEPQAESASSDDVASNDE